MEKSRSSLHLALYESAYATTARVVETAVSKIPEDVFDDRYEIFDLYNRGVKVEEVKMLSEVKYPLLDVENSSFHELIYILQKFASDPSIDVTKSGFGSYIANHVLKEKIARYNQEAMITTRKRLIAARLTPGGLIFFRRW